MWFSIGISRGECSRMYLHLVDGLPFLERGPG